MENLVLPRMKTVSEEELYHLLALMFCPYVGHSKAKILINYCGDAHAVFKASVTHLQKIPGIGEITAKAIKNFDAFSRVEKELEFIQKHQINVHPYTAKTYPQRLLDAPDAPLLLFALGDTDLNAMRVIGIVGTRKATEYGKQLTEELVKGLTQCGCLVVSGLAYGIDAIAHKSSLQNDLITVGVLGHGLDRLYPGNHRSLAKKMLEYGGGLLSEFPSGTLPDRENFPQRNRIVAAMCDATVVVETAIKGGAMITAHLANSYNREVFAYPGNIHDEFSQGCNWLIRHNKAALITSAQDLIENLNWDQGQKKQQQQLNLALELETGEKEIYLFLQSAKQSHIDQISSETELPLSELALHLIALEMKNLIRSKPGKVYALA